MVFYFSRANRCRIEVICYAASTETKVFHILWLNKFIFFDSTLLNIYYKLNGKKLVYTAHNVNMKTRDGGENLLNRISLKILYRIVDHIFVHTQAMKDELIREFGVAHGMVTVIPFGINKTIPDTELDSLNARKYLKLEKSDIVLLFFGNIAPYKGLDILVDSFELVAAEETKIKLIIAGSIKKSDDYWKDIEKAITKKKLHGRILKRIEFIPDKEVEVFFKAADALVLPYRFIYQSGPLFLAYNFGLPVIANNVGSFKSDILEGVTGFVSNGVDPDSLSKTIKKFINSSLCKDKNKTSHSIKKYANKKYSWNEIAAKTIRIYKQIEQEKKFYN